MALKDTPSPLGKANIGAKDFIKQNYSDTKSL